MYYLAQASVDTASKIITNIQAFHADMGDSQCFPDILENTVSNIESNGLKVEEIVADTGYSSILVFKALESKGIKGYISLKNKISNYASGFTFDKENDRFICQNGAYLTFRGMRTYSSTSSTRMYRSKKKDCDICPFRGPCVKKQNFKVIENVMEDDLYLRMRERVTSVKGKRMKNARSSSVEPVLGSLINYTGMRQINTKGIKQANKCMALAAAAYNLKKLLKFKVKKTHTNVHVIELLENSNSYAA